MREFKRTDRVGDQIQRELAVLIQREVKDPRLKLTTVSHVEVSKDLKNAKVYVTYMDSDNESEVTQRMQLLNKAAGFLRSNLAREMRLRAVPDLHFYYDDSLVRGSKLSNLIADAVAADAKNKAKDEGDA